MASLSLNIQHFLHLIVHDAFLSPSRWYDKDKLNVYIRKMSVFGCIIGWQPKDDDDDDDEEGNDDGEWEMKGHLI